MPRARQGKITYMVDFAALENFIGSLDALINTPEENAYMDDTVRAAFEEVEQDFNQQAAAFAMTGGSIKHMYEWGTAGINRGRTNMRPNPMSPRAQLWQPYLEGKGLNKTYGFTFKPSMAIVPKPTTADTGMSAEAISMLSDHIFWNKAMVFEMGQSVTIKPVNAKLLIMPFYKGNIPENAKPSDIARGYTMGKGPYSFTPGASVRGTFNGFWMNYWEGRGEELVNQRMVQMIEDDFDQDIEKPKSGKLHRAVPNSMEAAIKKERQRVERNARARARYRARKEQARGIE